MNAKITGIASWTPEDRLTNDQLSQMVDTNDEWITVTVPYSNFIYGASGVPATGKLTASDFTSLTIFVWSGGNKGTECHPVIKIDNIRAVPVK